MAISKQKARRVAYGLFYQLLSKYKPFTAPEPWSDSPADAKAIDEQLEWIMREMYRRSQ